MAIRIVHCTDIHLDKYFNYGDLTKGEIRRRDIEANFVKIVDYAIKQNVDIFLLSGDIFDRVKPSNSIRSFLANQIKRLVMQEFKILLLVEITMRLKWEMKP